MKKGKLVAINRRVRKDLEMAGLNQEIIILLEEAADILEELEKHGFDRLSCQIFRLGVLVTKISERMKEKGGRNGKE